MSAFRTEFQIPTADFDIRHHHGILALGSCFTEHIGDKLRALKFNINLNPFGILYQPMAIATGLQRLFNPVPYSERELQYHNGLWHSFEHHGRFNSMDVSETLRMINSELALGAVALRKVDFLLLTFGTSTVYTLKQTGRLVANCHKFPGHSFEKRRLSIQEIVDVFIPLFREFNRERPAGRIILTISPVRHLREGFVENQRSKAVLVLAAEALCREFDFVSYFPAYELLLDDLRDYRFYADDMVHPALAAINYIWSKWTTTYFSEETRQLIRAIEKIKTGLSHKPFQPDSPAYSEFLDKLKREIENIESRWPLLDLSAERAAINALEYG